MLLGAAAVAVLAVGGGAAGPAVAQTAGAGPGTGQAAPGGTAQDLKAAIAEIRRRVEQQRQATSAAGAPAASTAADDLKGARERIESLAQTMVEMRTERDALRGQLLQARDDLQRTQQRLQGLEADQRNALGGAEARAAALEKDLASVRAKAEQLAAAGGEAATARDEARRGVAEREARLAAAQQEVERLKAGLASGQDATRALTAEAERLRGRAGELEQQLAKAKSDAEAGRAEAERRLAAEVDALKGQLAAAGKETDSLKGQLAAAGKETDSLRGMLAAAGKENDALKGQLASAGKENADLRAVAAASVEEVRTVSEQLIAALAEKSKLVAASLELSSSRALRDLQLVARDEGPPAPAAAGGPSAEAEPAAASPAVQLVARAEPAAGPPAAAEDSSTWAKTVLEGSLFAAGSERLAPEAVEPLARAARLIRDAKGGGVRIVGHTDANGDPEQNRRLSLRRAQTVRDYLVATYGIEASRFKLDGLGPDSPIASNDTAAGRRANRRVEIYVAR